MIPTLERILESPITALAVGLVVSALGLSGRFNVTASQIMLFFAWVVTVVALRSQPWQLMVGFSAVAAGSLLVLAYVFTPESVPSNTGVLKPKVILAPEGPRPKIEIGDSGIFINITDEYGSVVFPFLEHEQFKIEMIDGHVKFSTRISDQDDKLIAEILRNEWQVAPPPGSWDRNYSEDALEVKDARGDIVLQLRVLSDRIQIQGAWWTDHFKHLGRIRISVTSGQQDGKRATRIYLIPKDGRPTPIKPWFKYPSAQHLGELVSN